jgi:hypothetical protein
VADNASGFVDFNQFNELNADEEARMFEQAMAEAEAATEREKLALRKSIEEARGKFNMKEGAYEGSVGDISQVASYSDYLQSKRDAAAAWAKLNERSKDPLLASVQGGAMTPEQRAALAKSGVDTQAREDAAALKASDFHAGRIKSADERDRYRKEQKDKWDKAMADSKPDLATLIANAKAAAKAGGTQVDYAGSYNPVASSSWAQQEGGKWVAQLRAAGAGDDAVRDVWNAWVGKGGEGNIDDGGYGNYPKKPGSGGQMAGAEGQWSQWFQKEK